MEIRVKIKDINYSELIEKFLPLVKERLRNEEGAAAKALYAIACLPTGMMRAAIDRLPQDTKDEFVVYLLNKNHDKILDKASEFIASQGVSMTVEDVKASLESEP